MEESLGGLIYQPFLLKNPQLKGIFVGEFEKQTALGR